MLEVLFPIDFTFKIFIFYLSQLNYLLMLFYQQTPSTYFSPEASPPSIHHYSSAPGKQELYEGAGVYLSSVQLNSIHVDAGKKPTEILNKLLEHFFDL